MNSTLSFSNLSHALSTSGTAIPIWPATITKPNVSTLCFNPQATNVIYIYIYIYIYEAHILDVSRSHTMHHSRQGSSGRAISSSQRPLPDPTISAGKRPQATRLLRSWVRFPPGAWIFVCCECRVLSGTGLCDELITHPEESYRLWCIVVCDLETSRIGASYIYDISNLRVNM